jgi:hypothetical protein
MRGKQKRWWRRRSSRKSLDRLVTCRYLFTVE